MLLAAMAKTRNEAQRAQMAFHPENPLIIQSDKTVLIEVDNDRYVDARDVLARFAELEKSPHRISWTFRMLTVLR